MLQLEKCELSQGRRMFKCISRRLTAVLMASAIVVSQFSSITPAFADTATLGLPTEPTNGARINIGEHDIHFPTTS